MERRITSIICIMITFALVNEMSLNVYARDNNKRKTKERSGGFQKNICDITDRDSKVHCYCEDTREPRNATKAECWVFNGGIPHDDHIWHSFATQPILKTLSFNVRVDGALGYIPSIALFYLQHLKSINIKYGNIVDITPFAFCNLTNLNEISLSQNQIERLQKYSFAHLQNITLINLEDNMIIDVDAEAFYDLPKLKKLVFTKNNISMIRNGTFQQTFNLLELNLNKNNIYYLNRRTFDGLANLKKLDLQNNRLQNLTEFTFAELWNLQELLLGKNDLRNMSERAFDGLSQLRKLSLDDNKLVSLSSGLFEGVRGLNSLDLRSNKLFALTFDNIKPILDNLIPQNSNLLLEENNFICDCRLKWIHLLRNETKSQNTKDSLDKVTCKMDSPIVSSAYNKMPGTLHDRTMDYNQDILHAGLTIETSNGKNNVTDTKSLSDEKSKNDGYDTIKKNVMQNVMNILPDNLPCRNEVIITTVMPRYIVDPIIPIQNEMKTYRFYEMNSSNILLRSSVLVSWSICLRFLFT